MMEVPVILKPVNSFAEQINNFISVKEFKDTQTIYSRKVWENPNTLFHTLFSQTLILIELTWPSYVKSNVDYTRYVYLEPPKRWLYDI